MTRSSGFRGLLLTALLSILPGVGSAETAPPSIPATPAGHALAGWLDAFNSGDEEKVGTFAQAHAPWLSLDQQMGQRASTGGYDLASIDGSGRLWIVFHVTQGDWEGAGVEPDIKAPAADALDEALKRARGGQAAQYRPKISQHNTAAAAETFRDWTDCAPGIFTRASHAAATSGAMPCSSFPRINAAGRAAAFSKALSSG